MDDAGASAHVQGRAGAPDAVSCVVTASPPPSDAHGAAAIWLALGTVVDPELAVVSIVELGIVRHVERSDGAWVVTITPTYSGCPAMRVIDEDIRSAVAAVTADPLRIVTVLAPAWTTDWIAPEARRRLHGAGIAPPQGAAPAIGAQPVVFRRTRDVVPCPNCGSLRTAEIARFGSTACKAQYRCADCLEPFDYFKPH